MTILSRRLFLALSFGVAGAILPTMASAQALTGDPIKIGVLLPLTGAGAGLGIPISNGAKLAEKTINANGGFKGRPLKLIIEDDATNPDTAISKANALIYGEKVIALLGPVQTANTVAVGGLTHPISFPQIAVSGLGPAVERERKCVFHQGPSQELNARAMLEYAKHIGAKKIGVLYDSGYGTVVFNELRKLNAAYGVDFVAAEKFEVAATDTTAQAAKLRAAKPDALFVIGVTGIPIRSIRQLQMKELIIAPSALSSYEVVKSMGDAADNIVIAEFLVGEDPLPNQKEFVALHQKEYGRFPKLVEAIGWDAVYIVLAALNKVGPDAGNAKLCEAMRGPYFGALATYDFSANDLNGIKLSSFIYSKLVGGQFTRLPFRVAQ